MLAFTRFCEAEGVSDKLKVGARHVIRYWQHTRHLSSATLYNHHRALCIVWNLAELPGVPPKPKPLTATR